MSNQAELSQAIATVERQISEAKSEVAKKSLNAKLERLKEELKSGAKKGTSTLATLSSARKSVRKLASKDFTALIEKLSKKQEYAFLKGYSNDKLKDDLKRVAKPVGYRFVGDNTKKPTIPQIKKGLKDGTVYYEARPIRSDVSRVVQLGDGGTISDKEIKLATTYGKMLNDLNKQKQFNKKIEQNSKLNSFAKSNGITIDNNNIIFVNGTKVAFIEKINQQTGQDKLNWVVKKFDTGGRIDLFEDYENIPANIQEILDKYSDAFGGDGSDMDYKDTANMLKEFEAEGYTFDYGLDNEPFGLRPIGVKLNELRDYEDFDDDKMAKGGGVEDCIDYIKNSESIRNNGYYLHINSLNKYVDSGAKIPKIKPFCLITFNSGGQKNLKAIDTINATLLSSEIAKLLNIDIELARIIVSEQTTRSKRFTMDMLDKIKNNNIIVADRETIVCTNLSNKFAEGGGVGEINIKSLEGYWQSYNKGVMSGKKDGGYVTIKNEADLKDYITQKIGNVVKDIKLLEKGKNYPYNTTNPYYEDTYSVTLKNGITFEVERSYGRPSWSGNVDYKEQISIKNINNKMAEGGNIESSIDKLYEKAGFMNGDMNWQFRLLEMLQDGSSEAHDIYQGLSEEQKEEVLQELYDMDNDMGSYGEGDMETSRENLEIMLHDAESGQKYAKGGGLGKKDEMYQESKWLTKEQWEKWSEYVKTGKIDGKKENNIFAVARWVGAPVSKINAYEIEQRAKKYNKYAHGGTIDNSYLGKTSIGKSFYGWKAETSTTKQIKGYDWEITTMKRYGGELVSTATGGKSMKQDGYSTFEYSPFEDPNYSLVRSKPKMVNEKAVTKQHEEALKIFIEKMNEMSGEIMATGGGIEAPKYFKNGGQTYTWLNVTKMKSLIRFNNKKEAQEAKKILNNLNDEFTYHLVEEGDKFVIYRDFSKDEFLLNIINSIGTDAEWVNVSSMKKEGSFESETEARKKFESLSENGSKTYYLLTDGRKNTFYVYSDSNKSDKLVKEIMATGGTLEDNLLPPSKTYGENIAKAMEKFDISSNEARKKYGQYTIKQWSELLGEKMENGGEVGDISKSEIPRMQKITKLKGLYGYMPSINVVYYDSKSDKFYFQDFEGDYMEVRNISTLEQLDKFLKENNITLDKKMATGGSIPDNYEGRTPEDIWNSLSKRQRQHFLYDHLSEIEVYKNTGELPSSEIIKAYNSEWSTLDRDIKNRFTNHTREGQYATGGSVGGKKYSYLPNEDISKIVLKSKQVIGEDRILDGAYIKSSKSAKKANDPEMERAMRTLDKLKSEGKLIRLLDTRGTGKKYFQTIVPNKEEKGYWKRYESASRGSLGILQNELLSEEDVLNHILKTQPKLAKPTTRELYERFESEKKTIALGMIARGVAEDFMRDKFDKTMDWDKLTNEEKEEYNKAYKVKLNMFDNFLVSEFLELYYEKESIREKCKGTSRKTIDAIESVLRNIAKEYPEEKYAKGGGVDTDLHGKFGDDNPKLVNFDVDDLDEYETMVYNDFSEKLGKARALQILINNVEGDYTQLSPELAEIAEEQVTSEEWDEESNKRYFATGGNIDSDISKYKKQLIAKAKSKGLYENFGQDEVRKLEDKYGYTNEVRAFDNWAMNFDLSSLKQYAKGGGVSPYYGGMSEAEILKATVVYDNGGETLDRYTVFTPDSSVFGMSDSASGFNQYIGDDSEIEKGSHLGKRLKTVPKDIKSAVLNRMIEEEFGDGGSMYKKGGNTGYAYVPNADIEKIIAKDGKEYGQKVLLDGAYVKDKVRTPKMSRTQFEDDVYAYGSGGNLGKSLYVANSSFFDYNSYDTNLITDTLKAIGAKNIRLERERPNSPEVVVFNGDKQKAKEALNSAFDTETILIYEKDWRTSKYGEGGAIEVRKMKKEKEKMVSELFEKCGVFFAFSDKQFEENKTPLKEGEKYVAIGGGGYLPKGKVKELEEGMEAIERFGKETVKKKKLVEAEILDELQNHECFYTGDISDVVDLFEGTYTKQQIRDVYNKHREANQEYALGGSISDDVNPEDISFLQQKGYYFDGEFYFEADGEFIEVIQGSSPDERYKVAVLFRTNEIITISREMLDKISTSFGKNYKIELFTNAGVDLRSSAKGKYKNISVHRLPQSKMATGGEITSEEREQALKNSPKLNF